MDHVTYTPVQFYVLPLEIPNFLVGDKIKISIPVVNAGSMNTRVKLWVRIHESSAIGTGTLIEETVTPEQTLAPGASYTFIMSHTCVEKLNIGRDVFATVEYYHTYQAKWLDGVSGTWTNPIYNVIKIIYSFSIGIPTITQV